MLRLLMLVDLVVLARTPWAKDMHQWCRAHRKMWPGSLWTKIRLSVATIGQSQAWRRAWAKALEVWIPLGRVMLRPSVISWQVLPSRALMCRRGAGRIQLQHGASRSEPRAARV